MLGVVGRRYHADFRPVLRKALRNRNGLIRAQAAAIAAGLELEEKNRLWSGQAPEAYATAPARPARPMPGSALVGPMMRANVCRPGPQVAPSASECSTVADVCLIVEGAYPYVSGGVSSWVDGLIRRQPSLRF